MLWFLFSCSDPCSLSSAVPDFTPVCESAELVQYSGESRLAVSGEDGVLVLYLPEDLESGTKYGGTTGNPLLAVLTLTGREEVAFARMSTMTLDSIGPQEAELSLSLDFDSGDVSGPLVVPVRVE